MPDVGELGKGIQLEQFRQDFGDLDAPVYRNALRRIDLQTDRCRLYASPQPPQPSP